ncbi:hypothetical protein BDR05DRAFT_1057901 [Suillus weaverae]|nr:hypothetical protein BDR05DRAFT_1057901 [Suillus weaverae]
MTIVSRSVPAKPNQNHTSIPAHYLPKIRAHHMHESISKCALFNHMCTILLTCPSSPSIPDPECILYAALAHCSQTLSVLKSACRIWEDHLLPQISVLCEEKQTADMVKLGGSFRDGATPSDIKLLPLHSIEWTTFEDGTYDTALEQATVILRYFLCKLFVEMSGGFHLPDETGDRHFRGLTRFRQIYVLELILRLQVMLYASREHVPEDLRVLELANIVADSRYKLYDDFLPLDGRSLGKYLDAVRWATIAGLDGGGSKIILS